MSARNGHGWPRVLDDRRAAFETSTADGGTCTVLLVRHAEGRFVIYLHGARKTSAVITPAMHGTLLDALQRLAK